MSRYIDSVWMPALTLATLRAERNYLANVRKVGASPGPFIGPNPVRGANPITWVKRAALAKLRTELDMLRAELAEAQAEAGYAEAA